MNKEQQAIREAFMAGFEQEQKGGGAYYASRLTSVYLKGRLIARELGLYPGALAEYDDDRWARAPHEPRCSLCGECITCNLRPCRNGAEHAKAVDLTKPVKLECRLTACADPEHRAVEPEPVSCRPSIRSES